MSKTRMTLIAAVCMAGLLSGGAARADNDDDNWWPNWGMGRHMMGAPGWGGGTMGCGADTMLDRIDGRLAFLKAELKITDAQSGAWDKLAGIIRTTAESHNEMMRGMMKDVQEGEFFKKPLPERLTIQETHMEARLEQIRSVKAAVDKLYAVLDDNQKKAADDIVLPMMGVGMGRGMGPGMMRFD